MEENSHRKWEGSVFSSEEEEYFGIGKEQRMCLSLVSPERMTRERYLPCKYFAGDCDPQKQQWRGAKQWEVLWVGWPHKARERPMWHAPQDCQRGARKQVACIHPFVSSVGQRIFDEALTPQNFQVALARMPTVVRRVPNLGENREALAWKARRARRLPSCAAGWTHARAAYHRGDQSRRQVWPQGSEEVCNRYPIRGVCSLRRRVLLWSGW